MPCIARTNRNDRCSEVGCGESRWKCCHRPNRLCANSIGHVDGAAQPPNSELKGIVLPYRQALGRIPKGVRRCISNLIDNYDSMPSSSRVVENIANNSNSKLCHTPANMATYTEPIVPAPFPPDRISSAPETTNSKSPTNDAMVGVNRTPSPLPQRPQEPPETSAVR